VDVPRDVDEVINYVQAMNFGLARLADLPVSVRPIREIHERLMEGVRGGHAAGLPAQFSALSIILLLTTGCEQWSGRLSSRGNDSAVEEIHSPAAASSDALADPSASGDLAQSGEPPPPSATVAAATPSELVALGRVLDVPVNGITRAELRDSYTQARGERVHEALDILAPLGTPVLSATDGRLLKIFDSEAGGLMIYAADSSDRFILFYGHLDRYADGLSEGMRLSRGQVIGYVGTTGNAPIDTPHLHFGILRANPDVSWWTGTPVNPYLLLKEPAASE